MRICECCEEELKESPLYGFCEQCAEDILIAMDNWFPNVLETCIAKVKNGDKKK